MEWRLAFAEDSPSTALVINGTGTALDERSSFSLALRAFSELPPELEITKCALIKPSENPVYDLDYRFIQVDRAKNPPFEMRGNCGHTMLAAITGASEMGFTERLKSGQKLRVQSLNSDEFYVCEVLQASSPRYVFNSSVAFLPPRLLKTFLPLDKASIAVNNGGLRIDVTVVNAGNPYVFADAADFGLNSPAELFAADGGVIVQLETLRRAVQQTLQIPAESAFPKIALLAESAQKLAARAIYLRGWHPTLALTGAVALAVAQNIEGSIPHALALKSSCPAGELRIETKGGAAAVSIISSGATLGDSVTAITIRNKKVVTFSSLEEYLVYASSPACADETEIQAA